MGEGCPLANSNDLPRFGSEFYAHCTCAQRALRCMFLTTTTGIVQAQRDGKGWTVVVPTVLSLPSHIVRNSLSTVKKIWHVLHVNCSLPWSNVQWKWTSLFLSDCIWIQNKIYRRDIPNNKKILTFSTRARFDYNLSFTIVLTLKESTIIKWQMVDTACQIPFGLTDQSALNDISCIKCHCCFHSWTHGHGPWLAMSMGSRVETKMSFDTLYLYDTHCMSNTTAASSIERI